MRTSFATFGRSRSEIARIAILAIAAVLMVPLASHLPVALTASVARFDHDALTTLNSWVGRAPAFDTLMTIVSNNSVLQGGVIMMLFWWAWFGASGSAEGRRRRELILCSLAALFVAVGAALVLRDALPFRPRPFADPAVPFVLPSGFRPLYDSSSFPSGHAVVFFALAAGLWSVSWRLGLFAFVHAVAIDTFPRMYLGLHYPSDVLSGMVLGIGVVVVVGRALLASTAARRVLAWGDRNPAPFYALLFLVSVETSMEFATTRMVLDLFTQRLV